MSFFDTVMADVTATVVELWDKIQNIGAAVGAVGIALDAMYLAATNSATHYADHVERVHFVTGLTTEASSGLIAAFRAQGTGSRLTIACSKWCWCLSGAVDPTSIRQKLAIYASRPRVGLIRR